MALHANLVPAVALIVACCSPLTATRTAASELVLRDVVIGLDALPTDFSYTLTDPLGSRSGDDAFTSAYGLHAGGRWSFTRAGERQGFFLGGDLTYEIAAYESGSNYTAYGVRALAGYGYALNDRWTLHATANLGGGLATFDVGTTSAFNAFSASGTYLSYGLDVGGDFTLSDRFLLTAAVGYQLTNNSLSASSQHLDVALDNQGLHIGLGLIYRFSSSPGPLE